MTKNTVSHINRFHFLFFCAKFHLKLKNSQYPAIFDNVSLKPLFFVSTNGSNNALCIHGLSSVCDCELSTPLNREKWLKNTTVACELMAAVIPTLPTGNPSSKYNKKNMISVSQTSAEGQASGMVPECMEKCNTSLHFLTCGYMAEVAGTRS